MLNKEIKEIISASKDRGWVLEPDAKRLFSIAGLDIPHFSRVNTAEEAIRFAKKIGYPVVCKVVSPLVIHKSERDGVAVGIESDEEVTETFERFSGTDGFAGMLVEETLSGIELIVGAKIDYQFGPIIILGIGGVGVEIYRDIAMRMAPLAETEVELMVKCLRAHELLEGYRGSEPVNLKELGRLLASFSGLVMDMGEMIESIDLNPVICSSTKCVVADARIILNE